MGDVKKMSPSTDIYLQQHMYVATKLRDVIQSSIEWLETTCLCVTHLIFFMYAMEN